MSGPYRVDVERQQTTINSGSGGYRLQVTVDNPVNMSEKIFVYRRTTLDNNIYDGVCSPSQLSLLPVDAPDPEYDPDPTRFRLSTFDTTYVDADSVDEAWEGIYSAISTLVEQLDVIDRFTESTEFRVGTTDLTHTSDTFLAVP